MPAGGSATGFPLAADAVCVHHPTKAATCACQACGAPMCATCAFPGSSGGQLCPRCVTLSDVEQSSPPPVIGRPAAMPLPAGVRCVQHPSVQAVERCGSCG